FALGPYLQFLLDPDLDPQPLTVETVLVALLMAGHGEVALVSVLVGAAPGVVDAHRVVGGDRAVEERPLRLAAVLRAQFLEGVRPPPELQHRPLLGREIDLRIYLVEGHDCHLAPRNERIILSQGYHPFSSLLG